MSETQRLLVKAVKAEKAAALWGTAHRINEAYAAFRSLAAKVGSVRARELIKKFI